MAAESNGTGIVRTVGGVIAAAVAIAMVVPVFAANPISAADFASRLGAGTTIAATSIPGGAAYQIQLRSDGTATMQWQRGDKSVRAGIWRATSAGYCVSWDGAAERCFTVVPNGKAYDIVDSGGKVIARWMT